MAEVFLARQAGFAGFEKLVVIKRILPNLAQDQELVRMFLDEARTAADLRHVNVVDVYDIGQDDEGPWLAMEFLHGQSVRRIQEEAAANAKPIGLGASLRIVADAARGLHHAHVKKDLRGKPLSIVHRDVSPHNLIVGFDGNTKIVDFGIAKAASRTTHTVAGTVKGKIAYLSPEQAAGAALDARSDLFSLGIILFELTTGRRVFLDAVETLDLDRIVRCEIPAPSSLVEEYERELERIVLRALARRPEDRFPDCAAFALAIESFAAAERVPCAGLQVAELMESLFPEEEREPPVPPEALAEPPQVTPAPQPITNLPEESDLFVGREDELARIAGLFTGGARLVTITGAGGAGKTRLARQAARRMLGDADVWFVDLVNARSLDGVCRAVGEALGVALSGATAAETSARLGIAIANRGRVVLVLDNFEQVSEHAAATVSRWMSEAEEARFLVTSREALKIPGEEARHLDSLPADAAIALFLERAKTAKPDFDPKPVDRAAIEKIVEKLDGLPLAIELAASRLGEMPPAKLLERLSLKGALGSLRSTIEWSWNLLEPHEQDALAQASVFRGGFSVDAAETIVDLPDENGEHAVADVLSALAGKSLVERHGDRRASEALRAPTDRWSLYESIREFAAEMLDGTGLFAATTRDRHAMYYVQVAEGWAAGVDAIGGEKKLGLIALELENVAAAFRHALAKSDADLALRALLALEPVFTRRGPFASLARMLDEVLDGALASKLHPQLRAKGLLARGQLRRTLGKTMEARDDLELALGAAREREDRWLEGRLIRAIGLLSWDEGHVDRSRAEYGKALGLHRKSGDRVYEGRTLGDLAGFDHEEGLLEDARAKYERALTVLRAAGDRRFEGVFLGYLGLLLQEQADFDAARAHYERSVAIAKEIDDRRTQGMFLGYEAILFHEQGKLDEARTLYGKALSLHRRLGDRVSMGFFLCFFGAAEAWRKADEAKLFLDAAHEHLVSTADPRMLLIHSLCRAQLELAQNPSRRAAIEERAGAAEAPARESMDVRLALRLLRRALAT